MKKIILLLPIIFLFSCGDFAKAKYEVAIPTDDGVYEYFLHTDSISYHDAGCISFIPMEKEYKGKVLIRCGRFTITQMK
jgi:hypothetical protein